MTPDVLSPAMRDPVLPDITEPLFHALVLALIPLSTATIIVQASPLVVLASAVVIVAERGGLAPIDTFSCLMKAMRTGTISAVNPSRLLFGAAVV